MEGEADGVSTQNIPSQTNTSQREEEEKTNTDDEVELESARSGRHPIAK